MPSNDAREGDGFFLNVPEKLDNPFPDFQFFRENRPVFFHETLKTWYVFDYDDVHAILQDSRFISNRMAGFVDEAPAEVRDDLRRITPQLETFMLLKDGPEHRRIRSGMQPGLTPATVKRLAAWIEKSADDLLDTSLKDGRIDACADYAFPLPAYVLSDLFGVRPEDRGKILDWSIAFVDFFNVVPITVRNSRRLIDSTTALVEYTHKLIDARRAAPRSGDFFSAITTPHSGASLTDDEIANNVMLLLLAGHIAVRNLIGNALFLLMTYPDQAARLKADPSLMTNLIEETLRYEPPLTMIPRVAAEDIAWKGNFFRSGQVVQLVIASANRDAAHFPDGETFDITRPPGKHLSFGAGVHGCFGAALAREVARIALEKILQRMPRMKFDGSKPVTWYRTAANRGPINLPVVNGG